MTTDIVIVGGGIAGFRARARLAASAASKRMSTKWPRRSRNLGVGITMPPHAMPAS